MFCSTRQLLRLKPTQICDLLALVNVAYYFVEKDLPSTALASELVNLDPSVNWFDPKNFVELRLKHKRRFQINFESPFNPFRNLYMYLNEAEKNYERACKTKAGRREPISINYKTLIKMVPDEHHIKDFLKKCAPAKDRRPPNRSASTTNKKGELLVKRTDDVAHLQEL